MRLDHLHELDLRNNRLTLKGLKPLLDLMREGRAPKLASLKLSGNPALFATAAAGGAAKEQRQATRPIPELEAALKDVGIRLDD